MLCCVVGVAGGIYVIRHVRRAARQAGDGGGVFVQDDQPQYERAHRRDGAPPVRQGYETQPTFST